MTVMNVADDQEEITTTLAVLEGAVSVHESWTGGEDDNEAVRLVSGEAMDVTGRHLVTTVSATPSCYVFAATLGRKGDGGHGGVGGGDSCDDSGGSGGSGDGGVSTRPAAVVHDRSGCSDACYAFALHTIRDAFSAIFSRAAM